MKIIKFLYNHHVGWGIVDRSKIKVLKADPFSSLALTAETIPLSQVKFLAPHDATKIILVGLNYHKHAQELHMEIPREPVIFLKPPTTLIAHQESIIYPRNVSRIDYEGELAVVVRARMRRVVPENVHKCLLGYTCLNDVTARHLQQKDGQWTRAKSFDTFCPLGPWIETEGNGNSLPLRTYVNGDKKQESNTRDFIFSLEDVVSFISQVMTINPGDVISTGTPCGVGPLLPGDKVRVEIDAVGTLENTVEAEKGE